MKFSIYVSICLSLINNLVTFSKQFCTTFLAKCLEKFKYVKNVAFLSNNTIRISGGPKGEGWGLWPLLIPKTAGDMFEVCDKDMFQ